jgi:hypothetical protein
MQNGIHTTSFTMPLLDFGNVRSTINAATSSGGSFGPVLDTSDHHFKVLTNVLKLPCTILCIQYSMCIGSILASYDAEIGKKINANPCIPKPGIVEDMNPPIHYGSAFMRALIWLWNLRDGAGQPGAKQQEQQSVGC